MIWENMLLGVHVLIAVGLIAFVLLQHGKGADMGAAFGSGSSGSLFGASGSANFLSRTTAILATLFFLTSLGLTYLVSLRTTPTDGVGQSVTQKLPVTPSKSADIPAPTPSAPSGSVMPANPGAPAVPGKDANSKAGEIPK
jgi:preprotein translocase subunit SecG